MSLFFVPKASVTKKEKPWGYELIWAHTEQYVGKVLFVRQGGQLSLQYHRKKVETLYLQSGRMVLLFEQEGGHLQEVFMNPGDAHHIPVLRKHRMRALEDCEVFEVSTPQLEDVVRLEDQYGRIPVSS